MYVRCVGLMLAQVTIEGSGREEYVPLDSLGPEGHPSPPVEGDEGESVSLVQSHSQSGKKSHRTRISSKPVLDTLDVSMLHKPTCIDIDCGTLCSWDLFIEDQRTR